MFKFYKDWLLPRIINKTCDSSSVEKQREKIIHKAEGHVLEIGIGSGLNLPFYDISRVESITGIDPSPELWNLRNKKAISDEVPLKFIECGAEDIPLENDSIDSVVATYCFCSIPEPEKALSEIKRILKKGGKFYFSEHALAPDNKISKWQNRLNPYWLKISGGCNLNKNITSLYEKSGMLFEQQEGMYLPGTKLANWHVWGTGTFKV